MKWSCVWLLFVLLPSLLSAAAFNWHQLGQYADKTLRFQPRKNGPDSVVITHTDKEAAPAFCNKLDCPKFKVLEKNSSYELREYVGTRWVSTTSVGIDYSTASYKNFMRLYDYISGANVKKEKITMTAPVINRILPGPGPACANNFTMSFFVSPKERRPPKPTDKAVFLSALPRMRVYVRSFSGFASKKDWLTEALKLAKALEGKAQYHDEFFYTAGYNSPFQLRNRHNEIWFIAK